MWAMNKNAVFWGGEMKITRFAEMASSIFLEELAKNVAVSNPLR